MHTYACIYVYIYIYIYSSVFFLLGVRVLNTIAERLYQNQ